MYPNIEVIATDNGGPPLSDTAYFALTVTDSNRAPIANDDSVTTSEDSSIATNPLSNDNDPDNDFLTILSISQPANGSASINIGDTTITYNPGPNYFGSDNLTYEISDGVSTDSATIFITVTSVNDPPTITGLPDTVTFDANSSEMLDIWTAVDDFETPDSLLTYNFFAIPDTLILAYNSNSGFLNISAKDTMNGVNSDLFIVIDDPQGASVSDTILVSVLPVVSVDDLTDNRIPREYVLMQNYPNPFNPTTTIQYQLPRPGNVKLVIYNLLGQAVRSLANGPVEAGYHQVQWDGRNESGVKVSSGIYIYRFEATSISEAGNGFRKVRKMIMLK